jgi:hypothetical protein
VPHFHRTEVQQVNEALRTKLSQMVVLRQKLERTLSGTRLESNRVGHHIRDLTQLLQRLVSLHYYFHVISHQNDFVCFQISQ